MLEFSFKELLTPNIWLGVTAENQAMVDERVDWVIVGGEKAYKKGRIMQYEWVKDIYSQCQKTQTSFFFKQWGDCEKKIKSMQGIDNELLHKIENTKEFPKN